MRTLIQNVKILVDGKVELTSCSLSPEAVSFGVFSDHSAFDRIIDIVKNAGEIHPDADVPFEAVIDNTFAENAVL